MSCWSQKAFTCASSSDSARVRAAAAGGEGRGGAPPGDRPGVERPEEGPGERPGERCMSFSRGGVQACCDASGARRCATCRVSRSDSERMLVYAPLSFQSHHSPYDCLMIVYRYVVYPLTPPTRHTPPPHTPGRELALAAAT